MSERVECPYCGTPISVPSAGDNISSSYMRCNNCRGVFEFMPDFGTFSLPDRGDGFKTSRDYTSGFDRYTTAEAGAEVPQSGSGAACCCVIIMMILFFFLDDFLALFGILF